MGYIALGCIIVGIVLFWYGPAPLRRPRGQGINVLERVELGGVKQWISIRGTDARNPVLLFLHGGPGSANLAKLRFQCPELEEHFVIVSWDQRGAGKSFSLWERRDALTVAQLRDDTHALVAYLKARLGVEKIYVMGFSWGTALGLWAVHDTPEDFHAFISVGQVVNFREGERRSLAFVRQMAQERNDPEALEELAGIDPAYDAADWSRQLNRQRKWLLAYGGVYHTTQSYRHEVGMLVKAREYALMEFAFWPLAQSRSLQTLWPEVMTIDFTSEVTELAVPVYFLVGRYDYNAPFALTEDYYEHLSAPHKELIWFEGAAHDLFFDQPDLLVATVRAIATK